jgi:predicted O-methyltransferase YrrM
MEEEAKPAAKLADFGIDEAEVLRWFEIAASYYPSHPFPEQPSEGALYHYANPHFPLADAFALLAVMATRRPRRYLEIGAGYSSCAAIDISRQYLSDAVEFTFIEPYPDLARPPAGGRAGNIRPQRLQDVPLDVFERLEANDILFIDSSHVGKTGSDVVDYLFRILPALRRGVLVHIHDIFFPFEYPRAWITEENRSWNEAYLVRAFLYGNPRYRVFYFCDWLYKCRRDLVERKMPRCVPHRGGSLWLE